MAGLSWFCINHPDDGNYENFGKNRDWRRVAVLPAIMRLPFIETRMFTVQLEDSSGKIWQRGSASGSPKTYVNVAQCFWRSPTCMSRRAITKGQLLATGDVWVRRM
jgi:hypothetical protein